MRCDYELDRFAAKVDVWGPAACWVWTASLTDSGYGRFSHDGRWSTAHRWLYERLFGSIPRGLELDHLCRNRPCVNPDHVEPVTRSVNLLRGRAGYESNRTLTVSQVKEIRSRYAQRVEDQYELAAAFNVSQATISRTINRVHWANV